MDVTPQGGDTKNGEITVIVRTLKAQNYPIKVSLEDNVETVKYKFIDTIQGDKTDEYILISLGRVLNHNKTLASYDVQDGQVIQIAKKPRKTEETNNAADNPPSSTASASNLGQHIQFHFGSDDEDGSDDIGNDDLSSFLHSSYPNNISISISNPFMNEHRESLPISDMRRRMNHILDLLTFSRTGFFVLNNPSQFPPSPQPNNSTEPVTFNEYFTVNREAHELLSNVRSRFSVYEQQLQEMQSSSNPSASATNFRCDDLRLLMRIQHHLSHVIHHLSSFTVVMQNDRPTLAFQVLPQRSDDDASNNNPTENSTDDNATSDANEGSSSQPSSETNNSRNASININSSTPIRLNNNNNSSNTTSFPNFLNISSNVFGISIPQGDRDRLSNLSNMILGNSLPLQSLNSVFSGILSTGGGAASSSSSSRTTPAGNQDRSNSRSSQQPPNEALAAATTRTVPTSQPSQQVNNENSAGSSNERRFPSINYDPAMPCDSYFQFPECRDINVQMDNIPRIEFDLGDENLNSTAPSLRNIIESFTEGLAGGSHPVFIGSMLNGGSMANAAPANTDPASRVHLPNDQEIFDDSTFSGALIQLLEQSGLLHRASEIVGPNIASASTLEQFPQRVSQLLDQYVFSNATGTDRETTIRQFIQRDPELFANLSNGLQAMSTIDLPGSLEQFFTNTLLRLYREFGDSNRAVSVQTTVNFIREFLFSLVRFFRKVLLSSPDSSGRDPNNANVLPSQFWHLVRNFLRTIVNRSITNVDNYLTTTSHQLTSNIQDAIDVIARMHLSLEINVNSLVVPRTIAPGMPLLTDQEYIVHIPEAHDWRLLVPQSWIPTIEQDIVRQRENNDPRTPFSASYESGRREKDSKRDNKNKSSK